ncbi:citrate synthase family protein [Rhizobium sp. L80/93]|uniref:citrate synthase family protein n=1 Tax=Rhizobium sp. E27B/91 TaxID=2819995 RepID=UPI001ADD4915|nr:citrate synthase family protein [Rhizobium sp. E27B/91]MBO9184616.1 citrate synthase family protein [Rhizobium sp. E27B/91]
MSWLTAEQALQLLGTKQQTLYANVSRGRIRAKPDPAEGRRSLYFRDDVLQLANRQAGRRKSETVAAEAIQWGDPMLPSAVSTVSDGRLFYRGRDVAALSENATLEEVAALLWDMRRPLFSLAQNGVSKDGATIASALVALAGRATRDLPSMERSQSALQADAQSVLATVANVLAPWSADQPLHRRLAESWGRPAAASILRRALVLFADHELNASTFAARVTASTGSSLSAAVLSGLATLTGPLHGGAWQAVKVLVGNAEELGAHEAVSRYLAQGRKLPAFGHRLYPHGDIRATTLLRHFELPTAFADLQEAAEKIVGERVNADFALTALAVAYDLPRDAPMTIFALARTVGWLAHAMEQAVGGRLIRPRARYIGPTLEA